MKVIKAFIHQHRAAAVVHALKDAGCRNLFVANGLGLLKAGYAGEEHYSIGLAETVTQECSLELLCEDDQLDQWVAIIRDNARTGRPEAGWICVTEAARAVPV